MPALGFRLADVVGWLGKTLARSIARLGFSEGKRIVQVYDTMRCSGDAGVLFAQGATERLLLRTTRFMANRLIPVVAERKTLNLSGQSLINPFTDCAGACNYSGGGLMQRDTC